MAKFDYEESARDALELINEFGDDTAKLIMPSGTPIDPLQLWLGNTVDDTEYATVIALDTISNKERSYLPDSLATKTVKRAYMEDVILTAVPQQGWKIRHNDTIYTIETLSDLKPNKTNVYYDMIVSK